MFIAYQLKQTNVAEYLLYMWQVEDLIRAAQWDIKTLRDTLVSRYNPSPEQEAQLIQWYSELIDMMRQEDILEKGHLQISKNVIIQLTDLHLQLLRTPKFPFYSAAYYKALPFIVELRAKNNAGEKPELETCFEALYGVMLLRLQKKEVSTETTRALEAISHVLSMLANYYIKDKNGELEEEGKRNESASSDLEKGADTK